MKIFSTIAAVLAFAFVSAIAASPAYAAPVDKCYTGTWYEAATSGSGFFADFSKDAKVVSWFTFNDNKPVWFTAQGAPSADKLDLYVTHGSYASFPADGREKVGTLTFDPIDAGSAKLTWSIDIGTEFCSGFGPGDPLCAGDKVVTRLTTPLPCE